MSEEIWKPYPKDPRYTVSNHGRVIGRKENMMKPYVCPKGYKRLGLCDAGKRKYEFVHRMVLSAFVGNSDLHVDHIDGNPSNNNVTNLRYVTPKENCANNMVLGTVNRGESHGMAKLTAAQVTEIRSKFVRIHAHKSNANDLAKEYGVSVGAILNLINRKSWKHLSKTKRAREWMKGNEK